jgi:8-oxo-dGTP pyrophosphatase MutT (NUDIX family)
LPKERDESATILAAGGIVRGTEAREGQILIVGRKRYGTDVGLPKGKLKPDEDFQTAALREVKEETGYEATIVGYAGTTHYRAGKRPKAVCYFIMTVDDVSASAPIAGKEIREVEWISPAKAESMLSYPEDRRLIAALFNLPRKLFL